MNILIFGEILWDLFGDEQKIGGAPFNFASHAVRMGADGAIVSAVGDDELGREALRLAGEYGVNCDRVAVLPGVPTGRCLVTLQEGVPSYNLVQGVAYDKIPVPAEALTADAFYFGTLAMRDARSEAALREMLEHGSFGEVFFDVNIRQNYYTAEKIRYGLSHCTIFKISREEIGVLNLLGIEGDERQCCRALREMFPGLRQILVTLDKDGSFAYDCAGDCFTDSPKPNTVAISTVGAGDSFSACYLCNLLAGKDISECLRRATLLSSYVVTQLGAIPEYPAALQKEITAK